MVTQQEKEMLLEPVCNCDMRTKLVGDGCRACNPEYWADMLANEDNEEEEWN